MVLNVAVPDLPKDARICTRHFPNGDTTNHPSLALGKRPQEVAYPFQLPAPPKIRKQRKQSPAVLVLTPHQYGHYLTVVQVLSMRIGLFHPYCQHQHLQPERVTFKSQSVLLTHRSARTTERQP